MIKINLKIEPRGEYREMEVAPGTTIETLYKQVQDEMPYTALMARLDNQYASLLHVLEEDNDGSYVDLLEQEGTSQVRHPGLVSGGGPYDQGDNVVRE